MTEGTVECGADVKFIVHLEMKGLQFHLEATTVQIGESSYYNSKTGMNNSLIVTLFSLRNHESTPPRRVMLEQNVFNWDDVSYYQMEPQR